MTQQQMPYHKLIGYQLALELVRLVARPRIQHAQLREQARKSAASAAPNAAEGAARSSRADKSRVFAIALAEACEAVAAVEIAGALPPCRCPGPIPDPIPNPNPNPNPPPGVGRPHPSRRVAIRCARC